MAVPSFVTIDYRDTLKWNATKVSKQPIFAQWVTFIPAPTVVITDKCRGYKKTYRMLRK